MNILFYKGNENNIIGGFEILGYKRITSNMQMLKAFSNSFI